jgi:hypothetical protein
MINETENNSPPLRREWWVFSTAIANGVLMLECALTGAFGIVRDPTAEEWGAGYSAPSKPYRWLEDGRVEVIIQDGESTRTPNGKN